MIEPRPHVSTENFPKFGRVVFEIYVRTHRQTDTGLHTRSSQYFASLYRTKNMYRETEQHTFRVTTSYKAPWIHNNTDHDYFM